MEPKKTYSPSTENDAPYPTIFDLAQPFGYQYKKNSIFVLNSVMYFGESTSIFTRWRLQPNQIKLKPRFKLLIIIEKFNTRDILLGLVISSWVEK